ILFFFSSRRRHTRSDRDWSSDVCSSDLPAGKTLPSPPRRLLISAPAHRMGSREATRSPLVLPGRTTARFGTPPAAKTCWATSARSEERRVGKEGRGGGARYAVKKKTSGE